MQKSKKILVTAFLIILLELPLFLLTTPVIAKADDLIIDENGSVSLIITDNSVLAATTSAPAPSAPSNPSPSTPAPAPAAPPSAPAKTNPPAPTSAPKVVPVAQANSNTTVKISPTTTTDKKLNITIQTTSSTPAPSTSKASTAPIATNKPSSSSTAQPTSSPNPANIQTTQKTVDNVILRDVNKTPVVTINADQNQSDQINIQQQNVNVTTQLPIQIDSKTHLVSVDTGNGTTQQVSVLPDQAVKGANDKLTSSSLTTTSSSVSLVQDRGQAEYVVNQTKTGKLFGVITLSLPSQVKISAQTGKTISVWQSPLSYFAGLFTK